MGLGTGFVKVCQPPKGRTGSTRTSCDDATPQGVAESPMVTFARPIRSTAPSDEELRALAESDRAEANEALYAKYHDRLTWHAVSIVHDAEEAHDIVQEVFIKAMRERRLYEADFKIQAWLYRVTRNLCFNTVRDRRRRGSILAAAPREESIGSNQVETVFGAERQEEILAAIGMLTGDHREILMLRYYEDLSYQEIAVRLEIKMGTVMSRLSRARDRLNEVIAVEETLRAAS